VDDPDAVTELVASRRAEMNPAVPGGKCLHSRGRDCLPAGILTGAEQGKFRRWQLDRYFYL
jgi:hypothetical protein